MINKIRINIGLFLGIFMILASSVTHAQDSIKVVGFERQTRDLMASTRPVKDINGQICGIIRIGTNDSLYVFEPNFGVIEELNKPGERILYVPAGTKSISIRHPQYVMVRNYLLPDIIASKASYVLILDVKKRDNTPYTDLELISNVEGADVYVDDIFYGVTPFSKRIPSGKHNIVLRANKFQPAGKEIMVQGPLQKFKFTLMPNKHFKYKSKAEK